MKKFIQMFSLAILAVVFGAVAVSAQTQVVKADIPFNFSVGAKSLQKGKYELKITKCAAGGASITIIDANGERLETVIGTFLANSNASTDRLVFTRDGQTHFLSGVITDSNRVTLPVWHSAAADEARAAAKETQVRERTGSSN